MVFKNLLDGYSNHPNICNKRLQENYTSFPRYSDILRLEQLEKIKKINKKAIINEIEKEAKWRIEDLNKRNLYRKELIPEINYRLKHQEEQKVKWIEQLKYLKYNENFEKKQKRSLDYKFDKDTLFLIHKNDLESHQNNIDKYFSSIKEVKQFPYMKPKNSTEIYHFNNEILNNKDMLNRNNDGKKSTQFLKHVLLMDNARKDNSLFPFLINDNQFNPCNQEEKQFLAHLSQSKKKRGKSFSGPQNLGNQLEHELEIGNRPLSKFSKKVRSPERIRNINKKSTSPQIINKIATGEGYHLANISYNNLGSDNSNKLFHINKKKQKSFNSNKIQIQSEIEKNRNGNQFRKSLKSLKSLPKNINKNNRQNKNTSNLKNSNSAIQFEKSISVHTSLVKTRFRFDYSKTCKNFNVPKNRLNINLNSNNKINEINIAFFSDDENENIKHNKILHSVLKKYKKIHEQKQILILNKKKLNQAEDLEKNYLDKNKNKNKNIFHTQNHNQKKSSNYINKIQKNPIRQNKFGQQKYENRSFVNKNNKHFIQKSEVNNAFLPNIDQRNIRSQYQKIIKNNELNSSQKSVCLNHEIKNSIDGKNINAFSNYGHRNKSDIYIYKGRKKIDQTYTLPQNEIDDSSNLPLNKSLDEKSIKNIKIEKGYSYNNSQNQSKRNKIPNLSPISEKRIQNYNSISITEEKNSLSQEEKALRRFQYWQNIVYPNYIPHYCNRKHIELEMNSFLSNRIKNHKFKFVSLNELSNSKLSFL